MKYYIFVIIVFIIGISTTYAQDLTYQETFSYDTVKYVNLYDNSIGLRYSSISGYGLSYAKRFLTDYTVCLSGMITYNENIRWTDMSKKVIEYETRNILQNFGIELQRDFFTSNKTKIYFLIGCSFFNDDNKDQSSNSSNRVENTFTIGTGIGLEWFMMKQFTTFFHFGYKFDNRNIEEYNKSSLEKKTTVGFGIGCSFYF